LILNALTSLIPPLPFYRWKTQVSGTGKDVPMNQLREGSRQAQEVRQKQEEVERES
jgi:hypothetical protein